MAGEYVDELLVKLGLESDAKGFREANNHFTMIRTTALAMGTAAIGAGIGLGKMSDGIARSIDAIGKWGDKADVGIRKAQQLMFALEKSGSANPEGEMMSMFENIDNLRKQAERGLLPDWAQYESGIDFYPLRDMNNEQALEFLMKEISGLPPEKQRRTLQELNFSTPAQHGVMTDYTGTHANFRRSDELGNADEELFEKSAAYMDALTELKKSVDSLRNVMAASLLPYMTEWLQETTETVQQYTPAAARAAEIMTGEGSSLEKLEALGADPEVSKALDNFWKQFKEWNAAIKYGGIAVDAFEEYTREKTGASLGDRMNAIREQRQKQEAQRHGQAAPPASGSGRSPEELNYSPSSQLIPHGNASELIEGNRSLLPSSSYVPRLHEPSTSKSTTLNINVDARGAGDPMLTAERVRGVVREEFGRIITSDMDNMPADYG